MTFLEAAIEILRRENGPLHVTKITRRAVDEKLLSHVGRDPEAAMRSCLNSAARGSHPLVERSKPGSFQIRPGAKLPELSVPESDTKVREIKEIEPVQPVEPQLEPNSVSEEDSQNHDDSKDAGSEPSAASSDPGRETPEPAAASGQAGARDSDDAGRNGRAPTEGRTRTRRSRRGSRGRGRGGEESVEVANGVGAETETETETETRATALDLQSESASAVEFTAPDGSGLEGVTDVALVMANAMSRLADERPELREELEAMQAQQPEPEPDDGAAPGESESRVHSRTREDSRTRADYTEERGGRKKRRRRRRTRKLDTTVLTSHRVGGAGRTQLLTQVESVLAEAGNRSLHVRQISEMLAAKNVLGGEISEIERVVTSALILDVNESATASRFVLRGDARYQLRSSRVAEAAGNAEAAVRKAARNLELQTEEQLVQWCGELGARALESLVRVYLAKDQMRIVQSLPLARGVARLVVVDPDDPEVKTLVFVVPRKAKYDLRQFESELERQNCEAGIVFAMGDSEPFTALEDLRVIDVRQFGANLMRHGIGIQTVEYRLPVLDSAVIESIGGLDT